MRSICLPLASIMLPAFGAVARPLDLPNTRCRFAVAEIRQLCDYCGPKLRAAYQSFELAALTAAHTKPTTVREERPPGGYRGLLGPVRLH